MLLQIAAGIACLPPRTKEDEDSVAENVVGRETKHESPDLNSFLFPLYDKWARPPGWMDKRQKQIEPWMADGRRRTCARVAKRPHGRKVVITF